MAEIDSSEQKRPEQIVEIPISISAFGVLNILFASYYLVRMSLVLHGIVKGYEGWETLETPEILDMLLSAFGIVFMSWLFVLGFGLIMMKRWARRGAVLYGWIQVVCMVIALGCFVISVKIGWTSMPKDIRAFINLNNGIAVTYWIYMVLLLVLMKTKKVKRAFGE